MQMLLKHKLLVGATTLVAMASAGGAYAATQSSGNPRQAFINDLAHRLHVTPSQLRSALKGAYMDRIQAAVKAGRLTQAQANKLEQRIQRGGTLPFFFRMRHRLFGGPPGGPLHVAAVYLGLTDAQLLGDLSSGQSLAHIANARGKSLTGLEQAIESAFKVQLDRRVAAGFISKPQEQRLLNRLSARIARLVNRSGIELPRPHGPGLRALPGPADGPLPGPPPPGAGSLPPAA